MKSMRLAVGALLIAMGALVAVAGAASAHTDLVASTPADDVTAARPIRSISLTFESTITPGLADVVLVPDDGPAITGDVTVRGSVVTVAVDPLKVAGRYDLSYRVVAEDGHPVTGSYRFTVSRLSAHRARALDASAAAGSAGSAAGSTGGSVAGSEAGSAGSAADSAAGAAGPVPTTTDAASTPTTDVFAQTASSWWQDSATELALAGLVGAIVAASVVRRSRVRSAEASHG